MDESYHHQQNRAMTCYVIRHSSLEGGSAGYHRNARRKEPGVVRPPYMEAGIAAGMVFSLYVLTLAPTLAAVGLALHFLLPIRATQAPLISGCHRLIPVRVRIGG